MNVGSLKLIEEVIINFSKLSSVNISQDAIYLEFIDVELGNPNINGDLTFSMRFAKNSFISFFYDNIWDVEFLSNFDYESYFLDENIIKDVRKIKFIDFEYLNKFFYNYNNQKDFSIDKEFDIHNIRNDFFCLIEFGDIGIVVGGDEMDFFFESEKLDDDILKELSNQWMMYFLNYHQKRNLIKDPMCENHPFNR
ncbi:MAG: hypothetical protein ACI389_05025 [Methanobrevibacter sp.]|uniref:hypothetical protein n=1 Tax=Methanobrevibacter sp. TaxID=66852 RepID=UPI003F0300E9